MCDLIRWNELDAGILIARYIQSRYHTATLSKIMQLLQSNIKGPFHDPQPHPPIFLQKS